MELHERLAAARKHANFDTAVEAAAALGVPYPTYAGHENGSSGFRSDRAELYARKFKVRFEWLMRGVGRMTEGEPSDAAMVGVYGLIGAGGTIDTSSAQIAAAEPLYLVRAPFDVPDGALAFQVVGESMWPKYDPGDIVICSMFSEHPDGVVGFPAAIETSDGSRYLKRVLLGSQPGLYHLESYNAPLMTDVHVVSFSSVIATIAASQVAKITDQVRRDVMRQIKTRKPARG